MGIEVGGEFYLSLSHFLSKTTDQFYHFIPDDAQLFFTSSGRCSLKIIIKALKLTKKDEVLLPSYLCEEVLKPFKEERIHVQFYKVDEHLIVDINDIKQKITKRTKALLIIHYFGFPQPIKLIQKLCRNYSIYLIEDVTQAFMSKQDNIPLGWFGDFNFTSFRKFLPVLDGSLLLFNKNLIYVKKVKWKKYYLGYYLYQYLRFFGMFLKCLYLRLGIIPKFFFLKPFEYADKILNEYPKPVEMSRLSKKLLKKFDFDSIILKRRENFQYLLKNWTCVSIKPLFKKLPNNVCPFGFPAITKNRDFIRQKLIKRKIYTPVHWNLPIEIDKKQFRTSWEISKNILTIPIDQRYGKPEMDWIINALKEIHS